MKNYIQQLRESYYFMNNRRNGYGIPNNSIMKPISNVGFDLDLPPLADIDDPQTLMRINTFVKQVNGVTTDPWRVIYNVYHKLHLAGLNFKLPAEKNLPTEPTVHQFNLSRYGGDFGVLPDGTWRDNSGFDKNFFIEFEIAPIEDGNYSLDASVYCLNNLEDSDDFDDLAEEEEYRYDNKMDDDDMEDDMDTDDEDGDEVVDYRDMDDEDEDQHDDEAVDYMDEDDDYMNESSGPNNRQLTEEMNDDENALILFMDNDAVTYEKSMLPALKGLLSKIGSDRYKRQDGITAFRKVVAFGINRFVEEMEDQKDDLFTAGRVERIRTMPVGQRIAMAGQYTQDFHTEANFGNYDDLIRGVSAKGFFDRKS